MKLVGRHYASGLPVQVELAGPQIARVVPLTSTAADLPWIAPGFVDLQVNGYLGQEFGAADLTVAKIEPIIEQMGRFGVTRFCPTVTTASLATLKHGLATLAAACENKPLIDRRVAGIHLEGPYISAVDGPRGAHPAQHCRPPDVREFDELQAAAGGRIRLVTLSPEYPQAPEFIRHVVTRGVRVAIGHTAASGEQIRAAVDAGATLSTHLGNGAHRMLPRHPNYLWDQLADDRLTATLIVDGQHLPPAVVQTFVRAKTPERIVLVSDLSGLAGLPPGEYASELCPLEILPDGRLVVAGQRELLAGAGRPIGVGIENVMRFAGVDLATAVRMAGSQALAALGLPAVDLQRGDPADLVLFDFPENEADESGGLRVRQTIVHGQTVFDAAAQR